MLLHLENFRVVPIGTECIAAVGAAGTIASKERPMYEARL